jgi:UDP-N-acetylglucosamine acyltransferase
MTQGIHSTAIVSPKAHIGKEVTVGPYSIVGDHVSLGDGVKLHSHVVIDGHTEIGEGCEIFPFASIGSPPQDKKFHGELTRLIIGKRTVIREHVTMNPGTEGGGGITQVGDDCLFLTASHVAHDCRVGNGVILSNNATLAGHVTVGNGVIIGGLAAIHQFVRIGDYAFIGGMCGVSKDVIPFGMVMYDPEPLGGLNLIGLKRRNIPREQIHELRQAFRELFFGEGTLSERAERLKATAKGAEAQALLAFVLSDSSRSFCLPEGDGGAESREAA